MTQKKNRVIFIAIAGVTLLAIIIFVFVIPRTQNVATLISTRQAFTNLGDEISTRIEHSPFQALVLLNELAESGELTTTTNFDFRTPSPWEPNVDGEIILAQADEDIKLSIEARVMGLPVDFTAFLNRERLALHSGIVDRNNFYGATFATFGQDFRQFGNLIGVLPQYIDLITEIFATVEETMNTEEEWKQTYIDFLVDIFVNMEYTTENVELFRHGQNVNARRTVYVITDDQIIEWLRDLLNIFQNDSMIRRQFDRYSVFQGVNLLPFNDIVLEFNQAIENFSDLTESVEFATYIDHDNRLIGMTFYTNMTLGGINTTILLSFDFGNSATGEWKFELEIDDGNTIEFIDLYWYFFETERGFENSISAVGNHGMLAMESVWNPNTNQFTLHFTDGDNFTYSHGGMFTTNENGGFTLQLDTIEIPHTGTLELELTATPGADIPQIEFINIDQWDWSIVEMIENSILGMLLF